MFPVVVFTDFCAEWCSFHVWSDADAWSQEPNQRSDSDDSVQQQPPKSMAEVTWNEAGNGRKTFSNIEGYINRNALNGSFFSLPFLVKKVATNLGLGHIAFFISSL